MPRDRTPSLGVFTLGGIIALASQRALNVLHGAKSSKRTNESSSTTKKASRHKSIVRRLYREVWNAHDVRTADTAAQQYVSDEHVLIDPSNPNPEPGVEAYMQHVRGNREALPDYVIAIDALIEEGDVVVAQLSFSASLNGRQARWTGTCVMEFEDDLIIKSWVNTDAMSALIQLGLMADLVHTGPDKSRPVTHALMGRDEPHPETVLTGKEWLLYFEEVHESWERRSMDSEQAAALRTDHKTGLAMAV
jgi:predicted ester cyclase